MLFTLSFGSTTSVNLIPNRSPIITTSPFAMIVPLARISKGSPANLSNSITDPSFTLSKSLSFISAPPTSTVSFTSIFSRILKFSRLLLSFFSLTPSVSWFFPEVSSLSWTFSSTTFSFFS